MKLALILSGAVSLGSFEAGVLTEVLYVLDLLAERGTPCTLDVITGASAGSMTAALVARAVMNDFADRALLHDAWVERIDIRALASAIPPNAFLSRAPIERTAADFLTGRPLGSAARARFAPEELRLGFTLSNITGVDYAIPDRLSQGAAFTSTFYAERRRFTIDRASAEDRETWEAVKRAAVASGNFPLAFPPTMLASAKESWPNAATDPLPGEFCYVDGGIFNNEPIKEAVQLSLAADGGEIDDERKFLLVDANLDRSAVQEFTSEKSLLATAARLAAIIEGESAANDWLRARRVNQEIAWRDELLPRLRGMVESNGVADPRAFNDELRRSAESIVARKQELFPGRYPADYLDQSLIRTARKHAEVIAGLGPERTAMLTTMIFVLNSIAGLDKKDELDIDVIYADPGQTAGDRLMSFGGFFNREWREFDFRLGRQKAYALLPRILGVEKDYPRERGPQGMDLYVNPVDYSGVTMRDADEAQRRVLRDSAVARVKAMATDYVPGPRWLRFAMGPIARWAVGRVIGKKIDELLEL
ncbi:MAG: patatin-like phospholipase family protein [Gemmatimonadaceae bacterium]|nr:patatin-like phospholipase family protein [Gemmatimonadaceae bacterium]NUQ93076.1 patatin-like phospholipase family protein [Gemmatimonadaceae bacterium]NUR18468.1 patatin-like phospholipase family protein [Gemmatimonadaceae bacterium]